MDEDTRRKLPPRWPKSEYDKLCDELGGPADIGFALKTLDFRSYCGEYPLGKVLPILLRFANENSARRHWPWAAMAIGLYKFESNEWKKYADEPSPKQIRELLVQIERGARDLRSGLADLEELSNRLPDPSSPLRRPHLAWLDEFIWQKIAGQISKEVSTDEATTLNVLTKKPAFFKDLVRAEAAAKLAAKRTDAGLLERERSQSNRALQSFVFRCDTIWKSMTGRTPTANRVVKAYPDFVIFVRTLAKVGNAPVPSRDQVLTSLRNTRTRD